MSERLERVKLLYERALHLEPASHAEFLRRECGDDEELRRELEELLEWKASGSFLAEPIPRLLQRDDVPPEDTGAVGDRIGSYRLIERIASGGMGTVWRAVRADETFAKEVAIKLIKRGMDSEAIVQRFHRERRLLAQLDHPGIARILDGGASADGQPYMVMELVHGVAFDVGAPLLPLAARLELFAKVCDAVDAAHELGIVHRDLKPSNLLITPEGEPKLLDFGIAKLVREEGREATLLTRTAERLLTPRYAAPEQLRGGEVTTATDVYALGVLLYELLCGQSPYERTTTLRELESAICDGAPHRPSTRTRGTTRRSLRGDLDTIALRAMAKEPERRYPRAGALAADLRRHLRQEPIFARGDSWSYRATTFARRNRWTLAVFAAIVLALSVGLYVARREALFAERMRDLAERRAEAVEREAALSRLGAASEALEAQRDATARTFLEAVPTAHRHWEWQHLAARLDRSLVRSNDLRLAGKEKMQRVAWLPGDRRLAVAGQDGHVHLVDSATLLIERSLPGHRVAGYLVATPDGQRLAFCCGRDPITVLDVASGQIEVRLSGGEDEVRCLDVDPSSRYLVAGTSEGRVRIFDLQARALHASIELEKRSQIRAVSYAPSGRKIAVTCNRAYVHLLEIENMRWAQRFQHHESRAFCVAWSPDERLLATGSLDHSLRVIDATSGELQRESVRVKGEVWTCAFLPSGREVVAGGAHLVRANLVSWREDVAFCGSGPMALSRDGERLAVSSAEGLAIFDAHTQGLLRAHASKGWVRGLAVSPDGRLVAAIDRNEGGIYEHRGPTLVPVPRASFGGEFACFDHSGDRLVVLHRDGDAEIRTVADWSVSRRIPESAATFGVIQEPWLIMARDLDRKGLAIVDLGTDLPPRAFGSHEVLCLAVSRDGAKLASIAKVARRVPDIRMALQVWSLPEGGLLWSQELPRLAYAVAFAPDGTILVGGDGGLSVWSFGVSTPVREIPFEASISSFAYSPDGTRLSTNDSDGAVRLWDGASLRHLVELGRHETGGFRTAWSADGSLLVSGGKDGVCLAFDGPASSAPK
ncbi:MAG: protein kinase [Planctomycetes bacterium]|nr:protein kinase [Planctomycetota bacterium]